MHFTAPVVAALAAFAATADAKRYVCDRQNYASVAKQILNPAYFCKFYLKDDRLHSPLKDFGPKQLTHLCHCFVQNSPHVRGPVKSVPIPKANYNVCNQKHINAVRNQYKHPVDFARFWNKGKNRKYSPMPTIPNVKAVRKAASCVIAQFEANQGGNGGGNGGQTTGATTPATTPASSPASSSPISTGTTGTPAARTTTASSAPQVFTSSTTFISTPVFAAPSSTTTSAASTTPVVPNLGCLLLGNCPTSTTLSTTAAITPAPTTTTTSSSSSSSSSSTSI